MIKRPKGLITVLVYLRFNQIDFHRIEIDLEHINKNNRSDFTARGVANIVLDMINNLISDSVDEKDFTNAKCLYFVEEKEYKNKNYRIVFCICDDEPNTIGVITLFRLGVK